jgi:UDPglucose 6-dehydrogenase
MPSVLDSGGVATDPVRIAVIGGGYVGAPTAAMLAHFGHEVVLAERDDRRRALLSAGRSHSLEEGLDELLTATTTSGRLTVVAGAADAVAGARIVFLCVATPPDDSGRSDLSELLAAAQQVSSALADGAVLVNKSTSPVGTTELITAAIERPDVAVVANPEFLSEGTAVRNSFRPTRTVVGGDPVAARAVADLFSPTGSPVVLCSARSAEVIKYAANAFLATKISFVNSIARLCDATGASFDDVAAGLAHDARIGGSYLSPGPGWGGPCLPKDLSALIATASEFGVELATVAAASEDNEAQVEHVVGQIEKAAGGSVAGQRIAVLGLTFKAATSDVRASPAIAVARSLVGRGATVAAFDPAAELDGADPGGASLVGSELDACRGAVVVAVLTEWPRFAEVDWAAVAAVVAAPRIYDARGVVDARAARAAGFTLASLGRP